MDKIESDRLRNETWLKIQTLLNSMCKEFENIEGLRGAKFEFHYGTGEPDPNKDYDPCVLTVRWAEFGKPRIKDPGPPFNPKRSEDDL